MRESGRIRSGVWDGHGILVIADPDSGVREYRFADCLGDENGKTRNDGQGEAVSRLGWEAESEESGRKGSIS